MLNQILSKQVCETIQVMVIDDHATMRKIVRRLLSQIGIFDVIEATNGLNALEILNDNTREEIPDIIISDLHMDGMDGIELCNKIRLSKKAGVKEIPVLMLTGELDEFILGVSKQVGVCKVMAKPIGAPELKGHISDALGYAV